MDDLAHVAAAQRLGELFPAVYLALHRRDGKQRPLAAASRAVLQHLTLTGPVRVGELARHLGRAQSVVSEIVTHLERDGLLERQRDPADARRTLVWLSGAGVARLDDERQVLSRELAARALARMSPPDVAALLRGLAALVAAAA
ncbi:MAG TPA: MarR family winged helix-turn-helix transcriptional regulator, partial [Polyangia bacterium]